LSIIFLTQNVNAQSNKQKDTLLVQSLIDSTRKYNDFNFKKALYFGDSALKLAKRINQTYGIIKAYGVLGDNYWFHSDYINAQKYYFRCYKLSDSMNYKGGIANSLYNIGWIVCIQQHNYGEIHYLYDANRIYGELRDTSAIKNVFGAIGSCYSDKFKYGKSKNDFDSALKYFNMTIEIGKKNKQWKRSIAVAYDNLGDLFSITSDYKSAVFYTDKALEIMKTLKDSTVIINCINNKASYYLYLKNVNEAIKLAKYVYAYSIRNDSREHQKSSILTLANSYSKMGEYEKAFKALNEYLNLKEETDREAYSNDLQQMQNTEEINKRETDLKQIRQQSEIQELKNKRKSIYISILIGIGIVILVFAYLAFRQSKIRQLTNLRLKEQNKVISEKKLEIEQSIEYAKGIQTAFLPEKDKLDSFLKHNFIFYKPKDVVSGDFYWYLIADDKKDILLACADCTGHGVPGALMSMIGINTLQQLSAERKIKSPSTILKYLNNEIKNSLKQNSDQTIRHDGMDIGLAHFDPINLKLKYSAANRPLYIVRDKEVMEYRATKYAIGGFTNYDQVFEEIEIDLKKGDFICMTTDGYADQFGGSNGKKFMTKNFKKLIVTISSLKSLEQLSELEKVFSQWKGNYNQVDDVCVIGINV